MKKVSHYILICICIALIMGCATTAQEGAIIGAYSMIDKGKYDSALKKLSHAEKYKEPTPQMMAEITYLKAVCYEGLNKPEDAIGTLKYLLDKFPDSTYAYQAREKLKKLEKGSKSVL
jgi:outer membrane protein assembly factor BamD (BamD/ComL family)